MATMDDAISNAGGMSDVGSYPETVGVDAFGGELQDTGSGAGAALSTAAKVVGEFQDKDYGTPQSSGAVVAQGLFQPGRAAGSQIQFFSRIRDEKANEQIDALYDEQERLNELEKKRQEDSTKQLERRQRELDNAIFSFSMRSKRVMERLGEEVEKQRRGFEAVERIRNRARRGESIRELRSVVER